MHKCKVTSFKEPDFVRIHSNLEENDGEQFLLSNYLDNLVLTIAAV